METTQKVCPFTIDSPQYSSRVCIGSSCAHYITFYRECSHVLTARMLAGIADSLAQITRELVVTPSVVREP